VSRWARWGPVGALVLALGAGLLVWSTSGGDAPSRQDAARTPMAVSSDAPRRSSLDELVAASDLVVRAAVVSTERGRLFGDPGDDNAIESRVVRLRVTDVLHGTGVTAGDALLVEEEGWSADGAPLVVDGLSGSAPGDDAIWFLTEVGTDEESRYVVVSAEGRYLVDGDRLIGATGDDPLVAQLRALGTAGLTAAIAAAP
jgi:hypothetical protein